ncbi:MAG: ATP-grasp domain-containing protein [Roseiflexaceae bacterium]
MHILFPSQPTAPAEPDADFQSEVVAAEAAGFTCLLFGLDELREGDLAGALRRCGVASEPGTPVIYRGWMLSSRDYTMLYEGLTGRGYVPVTDPRQYTEAHYLPNSYQHLRDATPESVWMTGADPDTAWMVYSQFRDYDVILKDYIKSAKHRWREACFIPAGIRRADFDRMLAAFLEARGELFTGGLVFRIYHPLVQLGTDMRGTPIHEEYRLFCWGGRIFVHVPFRNPADLALNRAEWEELAARFSNSFITLDVARQDDGSWIVVEAGDGGVSGLPLSIPPEEFYRALWDAAHEKF